LPQLYKFNSLRIFFHVFLATTQSDTNTILHCIVDLGDPDSTLSQELRNQGTCQQ